MLAKAVGHWKTAGGEKAIADFNAGKAPFRDRDLYVFCVDKGSITLANGGFPSYVGTSVNALKDVNGKAIGPALWDAVKAKPQGEVHYHWMNPVTHQVEAKVSFVEKVGSDLCGVGAYDAP